MTHSKCYIKHQEVLSYHQPLEKQIEHLPTFSTHKPKSDRVTKQAHTPIPDDWTEVNNEE